MGVYSYFFNENSKEYAKNVYFKTGNFYLNQFRTTQEVLDFYHQLIRDNNWNEHDTITCAHEERGVVHQYQDGKLLRPKVITMMVDAFEYEAEEEFDNQEETPL